MIPYALCFGLAAVSVSFTMAAWRLVTGSGLADGEWMPDIIAVNAVVMVVLLGVCLEL